MPIGTYTPPPGKIITQIFFLIFFFHFRCILLQISHQKCFFISISIRAGDWVGYPIYYCKTQSLGGSFTMPDPNLWAQLNYVSTQTQWGWVH